MPTPGAATNEIGAPARQFCPMLHERKKNRIAKERESEAARRYGETIRYSELIPFREPFPPTGARGAAR
jgi:hypothetical protein